MASKNTKNTGIIVTGDKKIDRKLKQLSSKLQKKAAKKSMRSAMKPMLKEIRSDFPKDSGVTAKSIKIKTSTKKGVTKMDIKSSDDNHIAKWLEFGSSKMEARPTFRPVFEAGKDKARATQRAEFLKELDKIIKEGK